MSVWFSFTPPSDGNYSLTFTGLTGATDISYEIFDGDPLSGGVSLSCHDNPNSVANFDGWLSTKNYYIRVYSWTSATATRITAGTLTIAPYTVAPLPVNNWCDAPVTVPVTANGGTITYVGLDGTNATYSLHRSCITSMNPPANEDDIWTTFTTTFSGNYIIKSTSTASYGLSIYTGSCGNFVQQACNLSFVGNTGATVTLSGNTTYFLRIWNTATTGGTSYDIGIEAPIPSTEFTGTGNWSDPTKWSSGVPDCATNNIDAIIGVGANCTLDIVGSCKSMNVLGTMNITGAANVLTVGCTDNNNVFALAANSTLNVSGGQLIINGRLRSVSTSGTLIQSGGEIIVDGNSGTLATSSPGHIVDMIVTTAANLQLTGGSIKIIDPVLTATTTDCSFKLYPSVPVSCGLNHTVIIGNGTGNDGGHANGYLINLAGATTANTVSLGNLIIDVGTTGTNRHVQSSNTIGILGNMTVTTGDYRATSATYIAGQLTNNGILTSTSTLGMAKYENAVVSASTTGQIISGAGIFRNAAATPVANCTSFLVNNTGAGVTVDMDEWIVNSTLTITAGKVFMRANGSGTLTHGVTAQPTLSGTYNATGTNYIVGKMKRYISTTTASDRFFPIGTSTQNRLVTLNPTSVSTAGHLEASFSTDDPGSITSPFTSQGILIEHTSESGYWTVAPSAATPFSSTNYTLRFNAAGFLRRDGNPITDVTNLRVIKAPDLNSWGTFTTTTTAASSGLTSMSLAGLNGFSVFAIGGTSTALPIELQSFTAKAFEKYNLVRWVTNSEQNIKQFLIERSKNGVDNWEVISRALPTNSNTQKSYEVIDNNPLQVSYYRLKSIENDGREELSAVVAVQRATGKLSLHAVYPSPTTDIVNIDFESAGNDEIVIEILDLLGRNIEAKNITANKGQNTQTINLNQLQTGIYTIRLKNNHETSTPLKFIKE